MHQGTRATETGMAQRLARRFTLWAHNSEVTRSKRVAGISPLVALQKLLVIKSDVKHNTGIAQRQSVSNTVLFQQDMQMSEFEDGYRLISGRSQDRNLLPVSHPLLTLKKLLVVLTRHLNSSRSSAELNWCKWQHTGHLESLGTRSTLVFSK